MPRMALMDVWRLDSCTQTCAGRSSCLHTVQLELADQGKSVVRYQGLVNNICSAGCCFVLFCFLTEDNISMHGDNVSRERVKAVGVRKLDSVRGTTTESVLKRAKQ